MCAETIRELLKPWLKKAQWRVAPAADGEYEKFSTPTHQLGTWVDLQIGLDLVHVLISQPQGWYRYDIAKGCLTNKVVGRFTPDEENAEDSRARYTDADLQRVLQNSVNNRRPGLIYIWSPNMPYSVRGVAEARQFAERNQMEFIAVVDPAAKADEVQKAASPMRIPASDHAPLASIELLRRGIRNHYPAMLVFKRGQIVSPIITGYKDPSLLSTIILRYK